MKLSNPLESRLIYKPYGRMSSAFVNKRKICSPKSTLYDINFRGLTKMKAKLICDGCKKTLKKLMVVDENSIFIIKDTVDGYSVMEHNNCKNHIILCEECYDESREQLKENECWMDLDMLDSVPNIIQDYFGDYDKLVKGIEKNNAP